MLRRSKKTEMDADVPSRTGLYVDIENLQEYARPFLSSIIANWDLSIPSPSMMYLYVRADLQVLWEMWAISQFPGVDINVRGIQHLSRNPSKNSADIALSLDATSDFLLNKVQHIAVISDDSDFAALFAKIQELHMERQSTQEKSPFLWIMTDREDTRSTTITEFGPNNFICVLGIEPKKIEQVSGSNGSAFNATELLNSVRADLSIGDPSNRDIARVIIEQIPVGDFKSSGCQPIIRQQWPTHNSANQGSAAFGIWFSSEILPELKSYGVLEPNPNRKPKLFVMTEAAKERVNSLL